LYIICTIVGPLSLTLDDEEQGQVEIYSTE